MSSVFSWLVRRERALRRLAGEEERLHRSIYVNIEPFCAWNKTSAAQSQFGGVYNLEFSPDGTMLVAACEKKSIVLFDPMTNRQTKAITSAHRDCVNCIKFLDERLFATCSDDATIALWDTRNLNVKLRSLHGHLNWVKNIEYSSTDGLLVTSGFDGSVFTWDINSYTEQSLLYRKVFNMSGLMRCRISPDASKLVISTTGGYIIIIHNLDLSTLAADLYGFKPNIYRVMQVNQHLNPYGATYQHMFSKANKRNRVEFASDFPEGNDAEVICSLQIHPQGWCALSRNISYDENTEWTTVHDIQECGRRGKNGDYDTDDTTTDDDDDDDDEDIPRRSADESDAEESRRQSAKKARLQVRPTTSSAAAASSSTASTTRGATKKRRKHVRPVRPVVEPTALRNGPADIWAADLTVRQRNNAERGQRMQSSRVYGIRSGMMTLDDGPQAERERNRLHALVVAGNAAASADSRVQPSGSDSTTSLSARLANASSSSTNPIVPDPADDLLTTSASQSGHIVRNTRRMLNYIQEPNKGKGFIKELCFSSDGRLICSPYGKGIRLLAFSPDCAELPKTLRPDGLARPLSVLRNIKCHSDIVVCSKFSPRQPLLASGCLQGKVVWHQPVF